MRTPTASTGRRACTWRNVDSKLEEYLRIARIGGTCTPVLSPIRLVNLMISVG